MFCCGAGDGGAGDTDGEERKFAKIEERGWKVDPEAIGEGGFGAVHLCTQVGSGKRRACKAMRLPSAVDREDFRAEVKVLKLCGKHKNICHCLDVAEDARYGYLVMQSCTGGELFDRIAKGNCTEKDAATAVVDVLSALNFLHGKNIIHRDLKPENLLYKDNAPASPLKLIDFGLAIKLAPGTYESEVCGTTSYMAPEVLKGKYQTECDIWSLGCICHFMLTGRLPFPGRNDDEKEARILRGTVNYTGKNWDGVSPEAVDFVKQLLNPKDKARINGHKAMKHPWISHRAKHAEPMNAGAVSSMKNYAEAHHFERAVRHSMATHLTHAELHRLRNTFELYDTDGNGSIKIADLKKVLGDEGHVDLSHVSNLDLDGDGEIDWREFVAAAMDEHDIYNEDNLEKVFMDVDADKSGTICQKEMAKFFGENHEITREIMEELRDRRGSDAAIAEIQMTLPEFKELMHLSKKTDDKKSHKKRHGHAACSKAQMVESSVPGDEKV